jgi:hypothetical protein
MGQRSAARRVTGALADATGRTDDEIVLVATVAVAGAGLVLILRTVEFLAYLGTRVVDR